MSGIIPSSSVARKFAMALSALFLVFFLLMHVTINTISLFSEEAFNKASHFMGTNPLIQFVMQPVLMAGIMYHIVMGVVLELKNKSARSVKYVVNNGGANSTWMSRNMIYTGLAVFLFLILHFKHFWVEEINYKYIEKLPENPNRYYEELVHVFQSPITVVIYILAFVFLALHLLHGFQSAFQSLGVDSRKAKCIKTLGKVYAIAVPFIFIVIALYHHFNH
jgi:succinate dehydrogenase / fumarate reductase cytochrome b subunit